MRGRCDFRTRRSSAVQFLGAGALGFRVHAKRYIGSGFSINVRHVTASSKGQDLGESAGRSRPHESLCQLRDMCRGLSCPFDSDSR